MSSQSTKPTTTSGLAEGEEPTPSQYISLK